MEDPVYLSKVFKSKSYLDKNGTSWNANTQPFVDPPVMYACTYLLTDTMNSKKVKIWKSSRKNRFAILYLAVQNPYLHAIFAEEWTNINTIISQRQLFHKSEYGLFKRSMWIREFILVPFSGKATCKNDWAPSVTFCWKVCI